MSIKPNISQAEKTDLLVSKVSCPVRARRLLAHGSLSTEHERRYLLLHEARQGKGLFFPKAVTFYVWLLHKGYSIAACNEFAQPQTDSPCWDRTTYTERHSSVMEVTVKLHLPDDKQSCSPELPCLFHQPMVCRALSKQTQGHVVPTQTSFQAPAGQNTRQALTANTAILTTRSETERRNCSQVTSPARQAGPHLFHRHSREVGVCLGFRTVLHADV